MKLTTIQDDSQALVVEQKSPESLGLFFFSLSALLLATGALGYLLCGAELPPKPTMLYTLLGVSSFLAVGTLVIFSNPYRELFSLDRRSRTIHILRRRLLGTLRCELGFDEVRSVALAGDGYFVLETRDRNIRFPAAEPLLLAKSTGVKRETKRCVAAIGSALNLPAPEPESPPGLTACAMQVLQNDADALILQDEPQGARVLSTMPLLGFLLIIAPWHRGAPMTAITGILAIAALYSWTHRSWYIFDRIGRRILVRYESWLRTTRHDSDFDDVPEVAIFEHRGLMWVNIRFSVWRTIQVEPSAASMVTQSASHCRNCELVAAMIREALGLDTPAARQAAEVAATYQANLMQRLGGDRA